MIEVQHTWRDEDGQKSTHSLNIVNGADPGDALDALQTISSASLTRYGIASKWPINDFTTPGPYDIRDRLVVAFRTVSGALLNVTVPAPLQAVLSNSDFVTLAEPAIANLADACIGVIQSRYGDLAASFVSAVRTHYSRKK